MTKADAKCLFDQANRALDTVQRRFLGVATRYGRVAILAGALAACAPALGQLWRLELLAAAHTLGEAVAIAGMAVMVESGAREGRSKAMCVQDDDPDQHDHHRWEDDGGSPCGGCTVRHPKDPPVVHFPSPPQKPANELPTGEEYGRQISGG